jgi:hypothetical protein
VRPDVVDVDVQTLADTGHLVREEHVALRRELVEDVDALGLRQVEPDALLAPVRVLEQHVHAGPEVHHAGATEAAHRVTPFDVLDLDHLRAPVGQDGRGRGHERVLRHLEDADALHHRGHDC